MHEGFSLRAITVTVCWILLVCTALASCKPVPEKYTITFYAEGAAVDSVKTAGNESITLPSAPEKGGYDFTGWYFGSGEQLTADYYADKALDGNVSVYAQYTLKEPVSAEFTVDSTGKLIGVTDIGAELVIPEYVNGTKVTSIANYLFKGNTVLQSVEIPDTVTLPGIECFRDCTALSEVKLSTSLTSIAPGAFEGCTALKSIDIPDSVRELRSDAFSGSGLESVDINRVTEIWQQAFYKCERLASVNLRSVESLSRSCFYGCTALTSVTVPDTVRETDHNIFSNCSQLAEINMPDSAFALPYSAFSGTAYSENPDNWENGALYVGKYLMCVNADFAGTVSFSVKAGTLVIADYALSSSGGGIVNVDGQSVNKTGNLTSVTFPDSVVRIGERAFYGCSKLASVALPDGLREIGSGAFTGTVAMTTQNHGVYVDNWLVDFDDSSVTSFTVRDGTAGIADGKLFSSALSITSVTLPSSLRHIGASCFSGAGFASVTLPAGLVSIGEQAFGNCSSLVSVNLGDCRSLESIGYSAFRSCALTEAVIPVSVTYVGGYAFNFNTGIVIKCEAASQPDGWASDWAKNGTGENTVQWNAA